MPVAEVRVLIAGQDPYPTPGHAVGWAFAGAPDVSPVPASLPARVGPYTEFRGASLADITPDGQRLLAVWRAGAKGAERAQLHLSDAPGQALKQVTTAEEPTRGGNFLPADPNIIVFERDRGGNEATQVFRRHLATGEETMLTEPGQRCDASVFNRAGTAVTITCAKVDATAAGAGGSTNALSLVEVKTGRVLGRVDLPGTGWWAADVAPDDRWVLVNRYISASQSEVWRVDLSTGQRSRLLPRDGELVGRSHALRAVGAAELAKPVELLEDALPEAAHYVREHSGDREAADVLDALLEPLQIL
jgi:hypothetical protein